MQSKPESEIVSERVRALSYLMWMHAAWRSPTVRELGKYMGWHSSSTPYAFLAGMIDAGMIEHVPLSPRTYRVTLAGQKFLNNHGGMQIEQQKT